MPGLTHSLIWLFCTLLEASVLVCALKTNSVRRYLFLNLYMGLSFLVSVGRFQALSRWGFGSLEYAYFYFYSDALLTIGLYFVLLNLYSLVFDEMKVEKYLRLGAVVLLGGTAWFSYAVINQSSHRLLSHFVFELSQNLYFVGLILTYVLWGAILKLRETRAVVNDSTNDAVAAVRVSILRERRCENKACRRRIGPLLAALIIIPAAVGAIGDNVYPLDLSLANMP